MKYELLVQTSKMKDVGLVIENFHPAPLGYTVVGQMSEEVAAGWLSNLTESTSAESLKRAPAVGFHAHIHGDGFQKHGWRNHAALIVTDDEQVTVVVWKHDGYYYLAARRCLR